MRNEFIEKTKKALDKFDDERIASCGFEVSDEKKEECILVMGLNPAGDKKDAVNEKKRKGKEKEDGLPYFYFVEDLSSGDNKDIIYNPYYKPIFVFFNEVFENAGGMKWPWCNKSLDPLKEKLKEFLKEYSEKKQHRIVEKIEKHHNDNKKKRITIYIGEMFYYHETNSKKLPRKKKDELINDGHNYYLEMLKLHIAKLKECNKKIKFIYINNAEVSNFLCGNDSKTNEFIDDVKVFYGGMLSGGRCMDNFSKHRLMSEIKEYLKEK